MVNLCSAFLYPPVWLGAGDSGLHKAEESRGPNKFGDTHTRIGAGVCFLHSCYDGIQYRFQVKAEVERHFDVGRNGRLQGLGEGFVCGVGTEAADVRPRGASYLFHYC